MLCKGNGGKQQQHNITEGGLHLADDKGRLGDQRRLQQIISLALALSGNGAGGERRAR